MIFSCDAPIVRCIAEHFRYELKHRKYIISFSRPAKAARRQLFFFYHQFWLFILWTQFIVNTTQVVMLSVASLFQLWFRASQHGSYNFLMQGVSFYRVITGSIELLYLLLCILWCSCGQVLRLWPNSCVLRHVGEQHLNITLWNEPFNQQKKIHEWISAW